MKRGPYVEGLTAKCMRCNKVRSLVSFEVYTKVRKRDGSEARRSTCRYCRIKTPLSRKEKRRSVALLVEKLKDNPCVDCGQRRPPVAMDFDHVRGTKHKDVARLVGDGYSFETVMAEISKCELVCACCHRVRTQKAKHWLPKRGHGKTEVTNEH